MESKLKCKQSDRRRRYLRLLLALVDQLDHTAHIDGCIAYILEELEKLGVKVEDERATADKFDPEYLNKIVD